MSQSVRLFQGLPVVDATRGQVVHIIKGDLTGGYTRTADRCAIHRALCREQHKKRDDVYVHTTKVYIKEPKGRHWVRYQASIGLRMQIAVHDQGGLMKEGDYTLNIPSKSNTLEGARNHNAKRKTRKTARVKRVFHPISERERPHYVGKE